MHSNVSDLGPVQRKLYRQLDACGKRASWDTIMPRMGGRTERAIIALADRANRLHGNIFHCDAWGVYIVRKLEDAQVQS